MSITGISSADPSLLSISSTPSTDQSTNPANLLDQTQGAGKAHRHHHGHHHHGAKAASSTDASATGAPDPNDPLSLVGTTLNVKA